MESPAMLGFLVFRGYLNYKTVFIFTGMAIAGNSGIICIGRNSEYCRYKCKRLKGVKRGSNNRRRSSHFNKQR
jgi:hypothetical protein